MDKILHKFDAATNSWAQTNVCTYGCIYGHDGAVWAQTQGFALSSYQHPLEDEAGNTTNVDCHEHANLMLAALGNNKPSACGIRICNEKYMFLKPVGDASGVQGCVLSRKGGGGATVIRTKTALLVGVWTKDGKISDSKAQNTGDTELNVMNVANELFGHNM